MLAVVMCLAKFVRTFFFPPKRFEFIQWGAFSTPIAYVPQQHIFQRFVFNWNLSFVVASDAPVHLLHWRWLRCEAYRPVGFHRTNLSILIQSIIKMKLAILASLIGAASAFAPASTGGMS